MQESTFQYEGHTLRYATAGTPEQPALLMIHGYTSSHHVWRTTMPALQDKLYCIAIDLLGHGESAVDPSGDYSIEAQSRRVLALADHLGIERFSLIGHSMGGQIALYIAAKLAPTRVDRLVDVDGVVSARLSNYLEKFVFPYFKMLNGTPFATLTENTYRFCSPRYKWAARIQFATWFHDFDSVDFDWWRIDREQATRPGIRHTWYHGMNAIKGLDLTPYLPAITVPVLAIFGRQDKTVPVSDGHLVETLVPDSRLILIDDCGHFPMYEKQTPYLEAVKGFLLA